MVIAQKNIPCNKGKEVALVASSSSSIRKSEKKKANKKKKPQVPGPSKKIAKQKGKTKADNGKGKCFHFQKDGYWKRNYPEYLTSLKDKKDKPSECMSISCYLDSDDAYSSSTTWVLDTSVSSHISFDMQELASSSSLQARDVRLGLAMAQLLKL